MTKPTLHLFDAVGVEIEYMIVSQKDLEIQGASDQILAHLLGEARPSENEVACGEIAVSNELVRHVIELKTNGPAKSLQGLDTQFHQVVKNINTFLKTSMMQLMPTGAHPWLHPDSPHISLWQYGDQIIYETYHRIFNCTGHGWSNLQSVHINLPFGNDEEFAKLHQAIRLLLPMIPALTASTPILEGERQNVLDMRLQFYGTNQAKIPEISGKIIPEAIYSEQDYQDKVLQPMYDAIASHDIDGILQEEWLNSRGAIARFDRNAIEIRIMDSQESPKADIACVAVIVGVLKYLIAETDLYLTDPLSVESLAVLYKSAIKFGLKTPIESASYTEQFGFKTPVKTARDFWEAAISAASQYIDAEHKHTVERILTVGNLAERINQALRLPLKRQGINIVYQELCHCLKYNHLFA